MVGGHPLVLRSVGRTDVGRRRAVNEDSYFRDDRMGFYVVADGVGGHNKGEVASRECVDQLEMWVRGRACTRAPSCYDRPLPWAMSSLPGSVATR